MAKDIKVSIVDNSELVRKAADEAIERALEAVGLKAEGYAKLLCPVDTGLLRNSITHAVSGHSASISNYHADKTNKAGTSQRVGRYSGTVGNEGDKSVIIGTNVEYAPYVEEGTQRTKAQPFIKPAVENHISEYKTIVEAMLKGS